jgi:hypothetical protein
MTVFLACESFAETSIVFDFSLFFSALSAFSAVKPENTKKGDSRNPEIPK